MTVKIEHIQSHSQEVLSIVYHMRKSITVELVDGYEDMKVDIYYTGEDNDKQLEYIVIEYENMAEKIYKPNMDYDFYMAVHEILGCIVADKFKDWAKISQSLFIGKITELVQSTIENEEIKID